MKRLMRLILPKKPPVKHFMQHCYEQGSSERASQSTHTLSRSLRTMGRGLQCQWLDT